MEIVSEVKKVLIKNENCCRKGQEEFLGLTQLRFFERNDDYSRIFLIGLFVTEFFFS